ncbi:MAG: hypothetical protein RMK80_05345 [Pseudobdellovibrionaceae bacterium]|nr:hypothetical protein [Pseudobdellovibrionaceae bacterium]
MNLNNLRKLFIACFLVLGEAFAQNMDTAPYWAIRPREPRLRWNPTFNNFPQFDWQVPYKIDHDQFLIGGVNFAPDSLIWKHGKKLDNNCLELRSDISYDLSLYQNCPAPISVKKLKTVVLINDQPVDPKGIIVLTKDRPITIKVYFAKNNRQISATLYAPKAKFVDLQVENGVWSGLLQIHSELTPDHQWLAQSFPIEENLIKVTAGKQNGLVSVKGYLGVRFNTLLSPPNQEDVIRFNERPLIDTNRTLISYQSHFKFPVLIAENAVSPKRVYWEAKDLKFGEWKELTHNHRNTKLSYHALRMPKYEASGRLTLSYGEDNKIINNLEFAMLGFIENPVSDQLDHWLTHRLGWKIRHLQNVHQNLELYQIQLSQVELRYHLQPGVWNIETTYGLLFGQYHFRFVNVPYKQMGFGFYWSRSLPVLFDRFLRWIPFLKYPKYVDLDFTYIPPYRSDVSFSAILNFHGKIFFPSRIFAEAGFSILRLSSFNENTQELFQGHSFMGTLGLGYMF